MQAGPPAFGASRGPLSGDGPPPADQETAVTAALPPPGEAEPAESGGSAGWVWRPGLGTGDAVSGLRWRFCFFFLTDPPLVRLGFAERWDPDARGIRAAPAATLESSELPPLFFVASVGQAVLCPVPVTVTGRSRRCAMFKPVSLFAPFLTSQPYGGHWLGRRRLRTAHEGDSPCLPCAMVPRAKPV